MSSVTPQYKSDDSGFWDHSMNQTDQNYHLSHGSGRLSTYSHHSGHDYGQQLNYNHHFGHSSAQAADYSHNRQSFVVGETLSLAL